MKEGLVANNAGKVEKAINEAIARLEDEEHTADNLSRLATLLSSSCGITAEALCFSCNYSDPPQSEMQVTFQSGGTTRTKMIRITHAPSQRMIFRSMYD
ncbi:MAG TPA: hypothetical protein VHK69_14170 [Chitinophagaceae bacterium]|nr:hypothetical protein [Chitinophagaceae bacterium]